MVFIKRCARGGPCYRRTSCIFLLVQYFFFPLFFICLLEITGIDFTVFFPITTNSKNVENFRNSFKVEVCRKNDFSFSLISKRIYPVVFAVQSLINFIGDILYEQNHFTLELSTVQHRTPLVFLTFSKIPLCQLYFPF